MLPLLNAAQVRALETAAAERLGLSTALLMERAGIAIGEAAARLLSPEGTAWILCGAGNNGGDGLVAARRLAELGRRVRVEVLGGEPKGADPARNYAALRTVGIEPAAIPPDVRIAPGDVVVDAIFGTGLNRAVTGAAAEAIERIRSWRQQGAKVIAADLPSGVPSDTGRLEGPCVRADLTLALGVLKLGHALEPGATFCGAIERIDIGLPSLELAGVRDVSVFLVEESDARRALPARDADTHKGTYGHVLAIAGSWGKTGAAALVGKAALRTGAGLVTIAARPEALAPAMAHAPELMGVELVGDGGLGLGDLNPLLEAADKKSALVIGPGIPRSEDTARLLSSLLEELDAPTVLDADALNAFASSPELLSRAKAPLLLTPHPGEMARLLGISTQEVQADRINAARSFATKHHVAVILKGARTLLATEDGRVFLNPTGNPGMASGGTGDVLAGMCGALLAQGLSIEETAKTAVFAHGLAGDLASARTGQLGLTASDVLEGLGGVWTRWGR